MLKFHSPPAILIKILRDMTLGLTQQIKENRIFYSYVREWHRKFILSSIFLILISQSSMRIPRREQLGKVF
jgi:hypothetical protein